MNKDELGEALLKKFGNAMVTKNQETKFLSTGYLPLNKIISGRYDGGIPQGRIIEIAGPSQSGKSHLATEIMIAAQKQGGVAIFMDHEKRYEVQYAARRGLNLTPPDLVFQRPLCWEDSNSNAIQIAEMVRASPDYGKDVPIVCVIDSVAAANPRSKMDIDGDGDKAKNLEFTMSDHTALARATSATLPVMASFCNKLNLTMLYLNQVREKPGVVYGDNTTIPGGRAMSFYADVRIQLGRKMDKDGKDIVGQIVTAKALKSLTAPFKTTSWVLSFEDNGDTVFDYEGSLVEHLVDNEILEAPSKGWIAFGGTKMRKSALIETAKSDPTVYQALIALLKD